MRALFPSPTLINGYRSSTPVISIFNLEDEEPGVKRKSYWSEVPEEAITRDERGIFDLRIFSLQCMFFTEPTMVICWYHCCIKKMRRRVQRRTPKGIQQKTTDRVS
jgi:hypothetical protein